MKARRISFDMSLRLWNDDLPLRSIIQQLGVTPDYLHVRGELITSSKYLAGKLARRHYASLANATACEDDIRAWLVRTSTMLAKAEELSRALMLGQVEAVFWIAMFGIAPSSVPVLDMALIKLIVDRGARVLIENYTQDGLDPFSKTWFPSPPARPHADS